ncbi:MAG: hypothetical protein ACP5QO_12470 [Clostridia bacterium]
MKTETIQIRPASTPGYSTGDGLGIRITCSHQGVSARPAPPWPSSSAANPLPVLARALPYLVSTGIPIRLPSFVPLRPALWPRLDINARPHSYSVFIRQSAVNLAPSMLYAVGVGLGAWVRTVEGSRRTIAPGNVPTADDAPPVRQDQVTGSWLAHYVARGYYRGHGGTGQWRESSVGGGMAGEGDHTEVLFREDGTYDEVGHYHSAVCHLKMAGSMVG